MRLLLDTHLLLWSSARPELLSEKAQNLLGSPEAELLFSAASIWEVSIKWAVGKGNLQIEPRLLRRELLNNGYVELPVTSEQALLVSMLPPIHKDPFDRILVAQAMAEGLLLVTVDKEIAKYPGPIRLV